MSGSISLLVILLSACHREGSPDALSAPAPLPLQVAPHVDEATALTAATRYRADYAQNRATVRRCEGFGADRGGCEAAGCIPDIDFGPHGEGGPSICRPPDEAVFAYLQEERRRACAASERGVWLVYQAGEGQAWASCGCPHQPPAALARDGHMTFDEETRRCRTDRQRCEARGGRFVPPTLLGEGVEHGLSPQEGAHESRYACERGSFPLDTETGTFLYGRWREDEARCEVVALRGFLTPAASTAYGPPRQGNDFRDHRCEE